MLSLSCREGGGCNHCDVCKITNHIDKNYSQEDFDTILNSDTMLELFLREIFFEDSELKIVIDYMKSLREDNLSLPSPPCPHDYVMGYEGDSCIDCDEMENLDVRVEVKRTSNRKIRYVATDFNTKVKQMELMDVFIDRLENNSEGVSKTAFLKSINKDNRGGRKNFDEIVNRGVMDRVVVRVGRNYYLRDNMIHRENNFHRKVYHIIFDNEPVSSSKILTLLNYRNSKGRRKLLQILKLMSEEDLINYSTNKWSVKR